MRWVVDEMGVRESERLTSVGGPDQGVHKLEHVVFGLAGAEREQPRAVEAQVDLREQKEEAAAEEGDGQDAAPARDALEVHRGRHGGRAAGRARVCGMRSRASLLI